MKIIQAIKTSFCVSLDRRTKGSFLFVVKSTRHTLNKDPTEIEVARKSAYALHSTDTLYIMKEGSVVDARVLSNRQLQKEA